MKAQSWPKILAPYKTTAIAEAVGVSAATASAWRSGGFVPSPEYYVKLAELLRITVEELARIISDHTMRQNLARVSEISAAV